MRTHLVRRCLLVVLLAMPGVVPGQSQGVEAGAIACDGDVDRQVDGRMRSCRLAREATISGHRLPAGSRVTLSSIGELAGARLGSDAPILGQVLPAGTELFFRLGGVLRHFWLPVDTLIQGHLVGAQDDGAGNRLHPNGRLLAIWLARDEEIDGVPCTTSGNVLRMSLMVIRMGTLRMVWFHPNGRLQQAMLSRDVTLQGHSFAKGDVVSLDAEGRIDLSAPKRYEW